LVDVLPSLPINIKYFAAFCAFGLLSATSQFAKAGQGESQNLDVSVVVEPSCSVSTERGAAGADLDASCPAYAKQSLVRDYVVSGEQRDAGGSGVSEQLFLVINF